MSIWDTEPNEAGGELTKEQFLRAVQKLRDMPPRPPHGTPDNPHLVHPRVYERGYGRCIECGAWVTNASPN